MNMGLAGSYLDLRYGTSYQGNSVTTYFNTGNTSEQFAIRGAGNGLYNFVETVGNLCFTVNGSVLEIDSCTGASNQQFAFDGQSDGSYSVQSAGGLCVSIANESSTVNATACTGSANEHWTIAGALPSSTVPCQATPAPNACPGYAVGSSKMPIMNVGIAGSYLDLRYGTSYTGNTLTTYANTSSADEQFMVKAVGNGLFELVETMGGLCITSNGSTMGIDTCSGGSTQLFTLSPDADGSYAIQGVSGLCVSVASEDNSVNLATCTGSASQHWNFGGAVPSSPACH